MRGSFPSLYLLLVVALTSVPTTYAHSSVSKNVLLRGLTKSCKQGLKPLLKDADINACMQLDQLASLLNGLGADDSIIDGVDTFLTKNLCPAKECSADVLSKAAKAVGQACAQDLQAGAQFAPDMVLYILAHYAEAKKVLCLADEQGKGGRPGDCVTQLLSNFQQNLGENVSLNQLRQFSSAQGSDQAVLQRVEQIVKNTTAFCTPCNQGILSIAMPTLKSSEQSFVQFPHALTQQCPASFLQSAAGSTASSSSTQYPAVGHKNQSQMGLAGTNGTMNGTLAGQNKSAAASKSSSKAVVVQPTTPGPMTVISVEPPINSTNVTGTRNSVNGDVERSNDPSNVVLTVFIASLLVVGLTIIL